MSLTNPNKVVTEQRLNEYHNAILPYLGGMPEMVANKFSKGDLYSTEERMIGQWIDGKPLYQKTVSVNLPSTANAISNVYQLDDDINMAYIVDGYHTVEGASIVYCNLNDSSLNGETWAFYSRFLIAKYSGEQHFYIKCAVGNTRISGGTALVTFRYTKTTDSPISIGSDTDYSTEEKIVGTWVDGKPLYQRTFVGKTPSTTSSADFASLNDLDIKDIVNINGYLIKPESATNNTYRFANTLGWNVWANKTAIRQSQSDNTYFLLDAYVTIQYTKTTD